MNIKGKKIKIKKHNYKSKNLYTMVISSKNDKLESLLHSYRYSSLQQVLKYNSGITLIALIITIIILLILAGVTINFVLSENGILNKSKYASEKYTNAQTEENAGLDDVENRINNIINGGGSSSIGDTWDDAKGVNTPKLSEGLIPVTINADGTVTELKSEEQLANWYNYKNKEWANAITKDKNGNITGYFVWIPRYEYKITYYTTEYKVGVSDDVTLYGDIDVKFIPTNQTSKDVEYDHIHPAFENGGASGKNNNFMNGEWKEEIPGFWVAKFPAGYQKNTITDNGGTLSTDLSNESDSLVFSDENYSNVEASYTTVAVGSININTKMSLPVFKPLTYAYNCICIGDSFTLAKQVTKATESKSFYGLNNNVDSHMLKNSEWSAVAYLAYSQYGRNGIEPNINNYYTSTNAPYRTPVTGVYANKTNAGKEQTLGKPWYEETIGMLGSSTGNKTGVYDLNGCVYEQIAGYISNGNDVLNSYKGNSNWVITTPNENGYETLSTEYATVYPYNNTSDTNANNWTRYKELKSEIYGYGNAILETSIKGDTSSGSWNRDNSFFPSNSFPFSTHNNSYSGSSSAGLFAFGAYKGSQSYAQSFRIVLIP